MLPVVSPPSVMPPRVELDVLDLTDRAEAMHRHPSWACPVAGCVAPRELFGRRWACSLHPS